MPTTPPRTRISTRARRIVLASVAVLGLLLIAACGPPSPPAQDAIDRHNYYRNVKGLGPLNVSAAAQIRAQVHADRVAAGAASCASVQLWHSPELASWYAGMSAGENMACVPGCPTDGKTAFDMWVASPGHLRNIVNPAYNNIGVATSCTGRVQIVVAQYHS